MASNLDAAVATLESALQAAFPTMPIAWMNRPFTPTNGVSWLQPTIIWGDAFLRTMEPTRRNTVIGLLRIGVHTQTGIGGGAAYRLADLVRDVYNRKELAGGVRCMPASAPRRDPLESVWFRLLVDIDFTVDELVT